MGKIKLKSTAGGSTTIKPDPALAVDEEVVIKKSELDKLASIDTKQLATAWVSFDGTTTPVTVLDSYNVSDVVRTATGTYDIYFETPMDNTNYSTSSDATTGGNKMARCTTRNLDRVTAQVTDADTGVAENQSMSTNIFGGKA